MRANDPKFPPRTATAPYQEVRGRLSAEELAAKLVKDGASAGEQALLARVSHVGQPGQPGEPSELMSPQRGVRS